MFVSAWIAYAGFNSCRRLVHWNPVPIAGGFWQTQFADLMVFFSIGYVAGQFVAGWVADRYGARRTLLFGGLLSVIITVALTPTVPLTIFCILQIFNGFAQGFGWPAISKLFSIWLPRAEWAIGFAWWSTSYVLGSFLFSALSRAASRISSLAPFLDSSASTIMPACILLLTTWFFYFRTKDLPTDVGLEPINATAESSAAVAGWNAILQNRNVRLLAGMYFFLKLTRYSLLFWLPLYLVETQHTSERTSFGLSSLLELAGFLGALIAAYTSERLLDGRRYSVGATMLYLAAFLFLLHPVIWAMGRIAIGLSIAVIGILIWGPDLLMTSVAVLEAVPIEQAGRASGFVDGVGSLGQLISPIIITVFVHWFGWNSMFNLFFLSSLVAASLLARNWDESQDAREIVTSDQNTSKHGFV
jgi:sugar phosphate permease